jgi:uncharacterized RDD family membrane protein YckC
MARAGDKTQVAPLGRRAAAALIDVGVFVSGAGAVIGGAAGAIFALNRGRGNVVEQLDRLSDRVNGVLETRHANGAIGLASTVAGVGLRNARSPGMKAMHLRRVDVRSGGPVSLRSAIIQQLVGFAWGRLARQVWRPAFERYQVRTAALAAEQREFHRRHPDDPHADTASPATRPSTGMASCCGRMLLPGAVQVLTTLLSPRRQNLADWVAGIVVVRD